MLRSAYIGLLVTRNMNINSQLFWDRRFSSGDWESDDGRSQTTYFAIMQTRNFRIPRDFYGCILDFGCGLGDAFPVYRQKYPAAKLVGVDFSSAAIEKCIASYESIADFICTDHYKCPEAEVIITSNVLEHLDNDQEVARSLLSKCRDLYIVVPYREQHLISEHLRAYDKHSFDALSPIRTKVFASKGWSQYGIKSCWWQIYIKNILRLIFRKPTLRRRMQILYHFHNPGFTPRIGSL